MTYTQAIETMYCAAKPAYADNDCERVIYNQNKPKSLDLEFKILANGKMVSKQIREFSGR